MKKRILSILLVLVMILVMMPVEIFAAAKAPAKVKAKAVSASYNSNKVSWKKISGASGYEVHRATSKAGKYKKVKTLTSVKKVTFTDKKLKTGTTYFYKVRSYSKVKGKKVYGKFSAVVKAKPVPGKVTVTATSATNKSNKVSWKKISGASGYELYRATSKSGKYTKIKTATSGKAGSFTDKNLTTGKTYYYKIRAYRKVSSKKVYGSYSKVVSAKPVQVQPTVKPTAIPKPTATSVPKPTATPIPLPTATPIPVKKPEIGKVWMMPAANTFNEFFNSPEHLDDWADTRSKIDIVGYADHEIMKRNTKEERISGFDTMNELGIPLGLEVGAVKEWAIAGGGVDDDINASGDLSKVGLKTFERQQDLYWSKFVEEGANIKAFTLDEPLSNVMNHSGLGAGKENIDYGFDTTTSEGWEEAFLYSIEQTAQFIEAVRAEYPDAAIGAIEAMPSNFTADILIRWNTLLNKRLEEGSSGRGQDFFRLDTDWNNNNRFDFRKGNVANSGWTEIKKLEDWCKSVGLPFSMIYWGPKYDGYWAKDETTDKAWYDQVMLQGAHYMAAGGSPDQYVVETWVRIGEYPDDFWIPQTKVPEKSAKSFTNSVVDLYNTYIDPVKEPLDIQNPGDISEWLNIGFDVTSSGWDNTSRLIMTIESDSGSREYDVSKFVYGEQNSVVVQLDVFDYKVGKLDLRDVNEISFNFTGSGTCSVNNVSLVARKTAANDMGDDVDVEEETSELFNGEPDMNVLPRTDAGVYQTLIFNQVLAERTNLEEWKFINFDVYVGDYDKLEASGCNVRLKLGTPSDEDIANDTANTLSYYHQSNAIYQFTDSVMNSMRRDGWVTIQLPVNGTIWKSDGFDFTQIKTLWFYLEDEGGQFPIPETTLSVRNIYLSGKTEPPKEIIPPAKPEADAGTLYLNEGITDRYDINWPSETPETNTYTHWPAVDNSDWNTWPSGITKPTNFSDYENIEFYFYIENQTFLKTHSGIDLRITLMSGDDIDKNGNIYSFRNQVVNAEGIGDNWYAIKIPLDNPLASTEEGSFDPAAVTGMRLKVQDIGPEVGVKATVQYAYFRLTGGTTTEEVNPLEKPAEEAIYLVDGVKQADINWPGSSEDTDIDKHWPAIDNSDWDTWPSGEEKPLNLSEYEKIKFYFYIDDTTFFDAQPDADLRLILMSGDNIDANGNIYSFKNQVLGVTGIGNNWYAIELPLKTPSVLSSCDLTAVTGMRLKIQPEDGEGKSVNTTVRYSYLRLTK